MEMVVAVMNAKIISITKMTIYLFLHRKQKNHKKIIFLWLSDQMIVEEVAKIYIIHSRSHSALILNIWNHIKITDVQHFNHQNPQWVTIWRFLNTSILYYYIFDFAEIIARDHVQKNPKANSIALLGGRGTHVVCMKTQTNIGGLTKAVFPTNDGENFQILSWNRIRSLLGKPLSTC